MYAIRLSTEYMKCADSDEVELFETAQDAEEELAYMSLRVELIGTPEIVEIEA